MSTKYDVDYFIQKFEAIPEENWCVGEYHGDNDTHCALGHCDDDIDRQPLRQLFANGCAKINDGHNLRYQQSTPKQRILAALRDIKAKAA